MTDQLDTLLQDQEDQVPFTFAGQTYRMRRKIKRLKFLRLINTDPAGALQLCFPEAEYERLEDLDLDADELKAVLTQLAEQFTGGDPNSGPSSRS